VPPARLRLLVACGAAGGISATFNAPIAGVMFSLELILRSFEAELFAVVVLASVAADVVGRAAFGDTPFLPLANFRLVSVAEYPLYLGLGILAGVVGVCFNRVLYAVEDVCDRLWPWGKGLRPAAGGLLLGVLLLALPEMYGVGYPVLQRAVSGRYVIAFVLVLLVGKMLATSLTIGIGGSGGIFGPSLFLGAMLGAAYGQAANDAAPHGAGRCLRTGRDGGRVRRCCSRADHLCPDRVRADRGLPHHSSSDVRDGRRNDAQQHHQPRHHLLAQTAASRHRPRGHPPHVAPTTDGGAGGATASSGSPHRDAARRSCGSLRRDAGDIASRGRRRWSLFAASCSEPTSSMRSRPISRTRPQPT
jgi:hypothetical protein